MSSTPTDRRHDTGAEHARLYAEVSAKLRRCVARQVNTSVANVDDACAHAWLKLIEVQPRGDTKFAWLCTVAIRKAWSLDAIDRRTTDLETSGAVERHTAPDRADVEFAELVQVLGTIHPRRRELLLLHAAGFTSSELGARGGISQQRARQLIYRARLQVKSRSARCDQRP